MSVDRHLGEILRNETLVVLEANHEYFEDVRGFGPAAQRSLSKLYRDAFAVLDALAWGEAPETLPATIDIPMTAGHAYQLRRRRYELGHTNLDRLDIRDQTTDPDELAELDALLATDRTAAFGLDRVLGAYGAAVRAG